MRVSRPNLPHCGRIDTQHLPLHNSAQVRAQSHHKLRLQVRRRHRGRLRGVEDPSQALPKERQSPKGSRNERLPDSHGLPYDYHGDLRPRELQVRPPPSRIACATVALSVSTPPIRSNNYSKSTQTHRPLQCRLWSTSWKTIEGRASTRPASVTF